MQGEPGAALRRLALHRRRRTADVRPALRHGRPPPALGPGLRHRVPGGLAAAARAARGADDGSARSGDRGRSLGLGLVEALDDPASLNRVKVRLPWRTDGGDGVWARLSNVDAGDGYGAVIVPAVGQEVLVGFVGGDPAHPVVLGSLYNGSQQPPFTVDADTNAVRALVSPDRHTVRLEDGDASAVTVKTGKGHSIVLSDKDSEVVITHQDSGNAIRLSADGIELTAAKGDITLSSSVRDHHARLAQARGQGIGPVEHRELGDLRRQGLGVAGAQGISRHHQLAGRHPVQTTDQRQPTRRRHAGGSTRR